MYSVSPFNTSISSVKNVKIVDCTLRDGEQQPGLVFSKNDKVTIAQQLDKLGVYEIEAGMPAVSNEDYKSISEIVDLGLNAKVSALARAKSDDINLVKETGAWGIRISLPISPLQLKYKLNKSEQEIHLMALKATEMAKELGLYVIFSPYDTTRCNLPFMLKLLEDLVERKLIDRVRLVDTVGCALPSTIRFLVRAMKSVIKEIPIEIHCHDDFGLALASTVEGIVTGCEYASCTMNGLGSRCGNAALEEVVMALEALYKVSTGVNLKYIHETALLVEKLSGISIHPHKSVVGANAFAHETGITVSGVVKNPFTAEAYAPELVGQKRRLVLGKKSGLASIKAVLETDNIKMSDDQAKLLLKKVKEYSIMKKGEVTNRELLEIAREINLL